MLGVTDIVDVNVADIVGAGDHCNPGESVDSGADHDVVAGTAGIVDMVVAGILESG